MRELTPEEAMEAQAEAEAGLDLLDTPQAGPAAIRGSVLRVGGYIGGMLLSVLSVSLLIRHLGVADFGRYITVLSLVTIVQGVTDAGLSQIGIREYATRAGGERDRLMRNLVGVRLTLTLAGVLVATGFSAVAGYTQAQVAGTFLAGLGLVLTVTQGTFAVPLSAGLRLGWVTAMDVLRQVLTVAFVVALVLGGAGLLAFFGIPIPVGILVLGATIAVTRGTMPMRPAFAPDEWRPILRAVLPFAGAVAIGGIYLRVTVVLTSLLTSDVQTGYYATAYRVLEVLIAIPALVVGSTLPVLARAARDDRERLAYVLERLFETTLIVGAGIAIALSLGAPFAILVLAGGKSDPSIPVLQIQSVALVANFVATSFSYGLLSLHRHRDLLATALVALGVSVVLTLVLVPLMEARGAALAFTLGELTVVAVAFWFLRRAAPDTRFPPRIVAVVALAAVTAGALALVPGLPSLVRAIGGSLVFAAVLLALGAIPAELRDALVPRRQTSSEKAST